MLIFGILLLHFVQGIDIKSTETNYVANTVKPLIEIQHPANYARWVMDHEYMQKLVMNCTSEEPNIDLEVKVNSNI